MTDPYENLANAIILQAVKDYRKAYKNLKRHPGGHVAALEVRELVHFFTGRWFEELSDVDGVRLVTDLNRKYDAEIGKEVVPDEVHTA